MNDTLFPSSFLVPSEVRQSVHLYNFTELMGARESCFKHLVSDKKDSQGVLLFLLAIVTHVAFVQEHISKHEAKTGVLSAINPIVMTELEKYQKTRDKVIF